MLFVAGSQRVAAMPWHCCDDALSATVAATYMQLTPRCFWTATLQARLYPLSAAGSCSLPACIGVHASDAALHAELLAHGWS